MPSRAQIILMAVKKRVTKSKQWQIYDLWGFRGFLRTPKNPLVMGLLLLLLSDFKQKKTLSTKITERQSVLQVRTVDHSHGAIHWIIVD